ncbi:MAG TPA: hypothetical protein VGV59_04630 [Pyrinomonadaceae bacterium]|nr:hypothetical protein [Pyrinomonadaceae bacterium]
MRAEAEATTAGERKRPLLLMVGAAARDGARWARRNLYALVVLTPLVAGTSYFGLGRLVEDHPEVSLTPGQSLACAVLVFCALVALSLSRASAEVYHVRRPEFLFDTLPVAADTHLSAALLVRATRGIVVALVALVARQIAGGRLAEAWLAVAVPVFVILLAVAQVFAAVGWIHWGHRRGRASAGVALGALGLCALMGGLLILIIVKPDRVPAWAQVGGGRFVGVTGGALVLAAVLLVVVRRAHERWRAFDMEYARRLREGGRRRRWRLVTTRVLERLVAPTVAAQLARDLRLTVRAFSSAVYVVAGVAALWVVALVAVLTTDVLPAGEASDDWFAATWLPSVLAVKFACAFSVATLGALVPVLVAYQLPHLWLERATGATGAQVWATKLWCARLVAAPAPLVVWAAGALTGRVPFFYVLPLLAECVWLWWLMSTLMGLFAFEMPEQPGLAIVLMLVLGLALGLGTALMWPAGLTLYAFGLRELSARGAARAAYRLRKEAE